jgi:UDP-N-acetylmuramoyl-tripeptide--D-alanyl-D-alanine ligase
MSIRFISKKIFDEVFLINTNYGETIKLSYDSRTDITNSVFFAFEGENFDGHDFIKQALDKGCLLVIASKSKQNLLKNITTEKILFVDKPLDFYSRLAKIHLAQFNIPKIAITGSNGKTTTKEMLYASLVAILSKDAVYKNAGNYNNHIGVPISALEVNKHHQVAIFEMGMNHEGEITNLCNIVMPTYGLITNIGLAHEGNFKLGQDGIQMAKGELFAHLEKNLGHAIINLDDERIVKEAHKRKFFKQTTYSISENSIFELTNIALPGEHHRNNALAALAIVKALGMPIQQAILGIKNMSPINGRMHIIKHNDITVIDDAYNANPDSFKAGLQASRSFKANRRIGVIGSMAELGNKSEYYHQELGKILPDYFDYLFLCGEMAEVLAKSAVNNAISEKKIVIKKTSQDLIKPLKDFINRGDLLFVKGSNSNNMCIIVENIFKEKL